MKALIVYESAYGNTEKIARAIGSAIGNDTRVLRAGKVNVNELESIDLLIVGSPTYAGRPVQPVKDFLSRIPDSSLKNVSVAAFDTRVSSKFARIFGYAANKIAKTLKFRGGTLVLPPEGFFVKGKEGPLYEGEELRATSWAKEIAK
jgi:flavodoxin I